MIRKSKMQAVNASAVVFGHVLAVFVVYMAYVLRRKKPERKKFEASLPVFHAKAFTDKTSTHVLMEPTRHMQLWVPWTAKVHAE